MTAFTAACSIIIAPNTASSNSNAWGWILPRTSGAIDGFWFPRGRTRATEESVENESFMVIGRVKVGNGIVLSRTDNPQRIDKVFNHAPNPLILSHAPTFFDVHSIRVSVDYRM
jgi:hypothetical protein